ncbi:MAG: hypothetical protein KDA45_11240 [Planctomycetales bacterium]|nr:hypothetical protein [Planctomycetales bacterium]
MNGQSKVVAELLRGLRHERDELKLQIHLGRKELQDEWQQLDDKLDALNHQYEPLKGAVEESATGVWESLLLVGSEIRDGFQRIRQAL